MLYASWTPAAGHNIKVGYGSASVDSGDRDRLSATSLNENSTAYINYGYQATEGLTTFAQLTHFDTEYGSDYESFTTAVIRAGVVFKF